MELLEVGDEIKCVKCGGWHPVFTKPICGNVSGAAELHRWAWFKCPKANGLFFGGRLGEPPHAIERWRRCASAPA
jgi:hypothetical protein